jgi:hypothetical protein
MSTKMKIMASHLVPILEVKPIYTHSVMSNRMTKITAFTGIIIILATGSSYALLEQVVKPQNMTANMTDLYLDNMSQFDDSGDGKISSREPIACPMC